MLLHGSVNSFSAMQVLAFVILTVELPLSKSLDNMQNVFAIEVREINFVGSIFSPSGL